MKKQYNFSKAKRGPALKVPSGKSRITIRLDEDVLDWFRKEVDEAGGGSYQNLINRALRAHIDRSEEPLEAILRRVVREELRRAKAHGLWLGQGVSKLVRRGSRLQLGTRKGKGLQILDVPGDFPRVTSKRVRALLDEA